MAHLTPPLGRLVGAFQKLPGIGPKSAQNLAFFILREPTSVAEELADALLEAKKQIKFCSNCCNLSAEDPCEMCSQAKRDQSTICVVSDARDVLAIDKTNEYHGTYHVLQGLMDPMKGIGPEHIKIKELVQRLQRLQSEDQPIKELIFALDPSIEGEATTLYLTKLLRPMDVPMSRIAFGLPMGGNLEFADEVTLVKALEGRRHI